MCFCQSSTELTFEFRWSTLTACQATRTLAMRRRTTRIKVHFLLLQTMNNVLSSKNISSEGLHLNHDIAEYLILLMPQVRRGRRKVSLERRLSTRSEWSAWEERPASPWYWRWQWLEESDKKCWSIVVDNWEVVFYFASSYLSSSQWQQSGENLKYDRGDNLWTVSETISQMAASHSRHNFEQHPPTVDNFNCKKRQMWG